MNNEKLSIKGPVNSTFTFFLEGIVAPVGGAFYVLGGMDGKAQDYVNILLD